MSSPLDCHVKWYQLLADAIFQQGILFSNSFSENEPLLPGENVIRSSNYFVTRTGANVPPLNGIHRLTIDDKEKAEQEREIEKVLLFTRTAVGENITFMIHLLPHCCSYDLLVPLLTQMSETHGLIGDIAYLMVLTLETYKQDTLKDSDDAPNLELRLIESVEQVNDFMDVMFEAFGVTISPTNTYESLQKMYRTSHKLIASEFPHLHYEKYVGYIDNKGVCCGSIIKLDAQLISRITGQPVRNEDESFYAIFAVGTKPEHTRHGYSTKLMRKLIESGFTKGATSIGVHSSTEAKSMYSKLKFEYFADHHTFVKPK